MTTSHNRVAVLHGVNFDIVERRDPSVYGGLSLHELESKINAGREGSNWKRSFPDQLRGRVLRVPAPRTRARRRAIVNAGAWSHYSRAIADALDVAGVPSIEVHLSNVEGRDEWRKLSVFDGLVLTKIFGKGPDGYREALELLARELDAGPG